jgi:hypothetical protein
MSNWKEIVGAVAPGLATVLGGPLAGGVVSILAEKLLGQSSGDAVQDEAKIAGMLSGGITPEIRARIVEAETALKMEAMKVGLEEKRIDAGIEQSFLADVSDARKTHGTDRDLVAMGVAVLLIWSALTAGTLFGLYNILSGGIKIQDVGIVATVFTVLGSVVGYVSNAAQQVLSYFYGSSRGSDRKTMVMTEAITSAGRRA